MLSVTNLKKSFGHIQAVDDVTLNFGEEEGEIVFIVGPNGAGKTTLVNLITGLHQPDSGEIVMDGTDLVGMEPADRVHTGLVRSFQIPHLFEELTVRENVRLPLLSKHGMTTSLFERHDSNEEVEQRVDSLITQFDLEDESETTIETLAHGDRKILDVAMAFALDPKYLLLDEPTSGVGTDEKRPIIEQLVDVSKNQNVTTIAIEHDMEIVKEYADRLVVLTQGSVYAVDEPRILEEDAELSRVLLGAEQ